MDYDISAGRMDAIISKLKCRYKIYAPKRVGKFVRYGEIRSVSEIVYDQKSDFSPKEVFYPIVQTLLYFRENECRESVVEDSKDIILFARSCDIHGIRRLDTMFLKNGGSQDNFYGRMRLKLKIFMMECMESFETCFCVSMGTNSTKDYSAAVRLCKEGLYIKIKDSLFLDYFKNETACEFEPGFVKENRHKVLIPDISDRSMLKQIHQLDFWHGFDEKCISCGGCNTVCITCSCFDTADVIYNETSRDGERRRIWSSCMLEDFTAMAGGHCVRPSPGERMRFKTMHKIYDYKYRFGEENMCVGCGRCDMRCPEGIHFSETINALASQVENLKTGEVETS